MRIDDLGDDELRARLINKAKLTPFDNPLGIGEEDLNDFYEQMADTFVKWRDLDGMEEIIEDLLEGEE